MSVPEERPHRAPQRLLDDPAVDAEARATLEAGRSALPDEATLGRIAANLEPAMARPSGLSLASKAGLSLVVLGLLGAGAFWAIGGGDPAALPDANADGVREATEWRAPSAAEEPDGPPQPAEALSAPVEVPSPVPTPASAAETDPVEDQSPTVRPTTEAQPADEAALLHAARDALPSSPGRARQLLRRHERLFPRSFLAEEREVLTIEALAALGHRPRAARRAMDFLAARPRSTYRGRVEAAVEFEPALGNRAGAPTTTVEGAMR